MPNLPEPDWTDVLRELARYASDHELDGPLSVKFSGDDPAYLLVAVSGPAHAAWFEHFGQGHRTRGVSDTADFHQSYGDLPSGAVVELTCHADALLPSAVAS